MEFSTVYKGITIVGNDTGTFSATIKGVKVTKASVQSIKNAIDKSDAFPVFEGFVNGDWGTDKPRKVKIVGHYLKRKKWGSDEEYWIMENGGKPRTVYTLDSEKALLELREAKQQYAKEIDALKKKHADALAKIQNRIKFIPFPRDKK